jgi:hypothetical protein
LEQLVPDSILGLRIRMACAIHDYSYYIGSTEQDKTDADIELFANGFRIIKQRSNKFTGLLRSAILSRYFLACAYGGSSSFYK